MRARTAAFLLGAVLVFYLTGCLWEGSLSLYDAVSDGAAISGLLGAAILILGVFGARFLIREIQFGFAAERLAMRLSDEGALDQESLDALPRSRGGRLNDGAADELYARRKAAVETAPDDWRAWYRFAAICAAGKDRSHARAAMRHAIKLSPPKSQELNRRTL